MDRNPRLATRLCFAAAGFGTACWAPLVSYAQARLGVSDATLGLLLLCLGAGSVAVLPAAGGLVARWGSRPLILVGGFGMALVLPWLALLGRPVSLALALAAFGAALGALDVAMNLHAVGVEQAAARPLMSGFHAHFSVGAFAGAGVGYMVFAIATTTGRFMGDPATARLGARSLFLLSGLMAVVGFAVLLTARAAPLALGGFVLIGLGIANVVPTLFRRAGNQPGMPAPIALAAVLTAGYAGLLAGPALVGFIAAAAGLRTAFFFLLVLMAVIPALSPSVASAARRG